MAQLKDLIVNGATRLLNGLNVSGSIKQNSEQVVTKVNNIAPDDSGHLSISIPTVNNATLTINQNNTSKGTFTANSSTNTTINLTDTTYSSQAAASGGTAVSLVTTGEKYTWNNKGTYSKPSTGIPKTDLDATVQASLDRADSAASNKMDKNNPTGTGSFSLNRLDSTTIGNYSVAEGEGTTASGNASHAEGVYTEASGDGSHAEGVLTTASGDKSHAEGYDTIASGDKSHAQGKHNIANTSHADIVGNGTSSSSRSNAYALDWDGNGYYAGDVYVGCNADSSGGSKLVRESNLLNLLYPVGSCYTTSTNTNPDTIFGGTWELINKQYRPQWITTGFTFNTTNTQEGAFVALLQGTNIEFRFIWKNKIAISDDTKPIGTLNKSSIGLVAAHTAYAVGQNDGLNAVGMFYIDLNITTPILNVLDWVTRATSYPTATGHNCYLEFVVNVRPENMVDSFCDQFIWKRTA